MTRDTLDAILLTALPVAVVVLVAVFAPAWAAVLVAVAIIASVTRTWIRRVRMRDAWRRRHGLDRHAR
jgi:Flp pilus assembly protein TadB